MPYAISTRITSFRRSGSSSRRRSPRAAAQAAPRARAGHRAATLRRLRYTEYAPEHQSGARQGIEMSLIRLFFFKKRTAEFFR